VPIDAAHELPRALLRRPEPQRWQWVRAVSSRIRVGLPTPSRLTPWSLSGVLAQQSQPPMESAAPARVGRAQIRQVGSSRPLPALWQSLLDTLGKRSASCFVTAQKSG